MVGEIDLWPLFNIYQHVWGVVLERSLEGEKKTEVQFISDQFNKCRPNFFKAKNLASSSINYQFTFSTKLVPKLPTKDQQSNDSTINFPSIWGGSKVFTHYIKVINEKEI